jgi:hypothetical protein
MGAMMGRHADTIPMHGSKQPQIIDEVQFHVKSTDLNILVRKYTRTTPATQALD